MRAIAFAFALLACLTAIYAMPSKADRPTSPVELLYGIVVNGATVSEGTVVLKAADGSFFVDGANLRAWRVRPSGRPTLMYKGRGYFSLATFPGIRVLIDTKKEQLILSFPPQFLEATSVQAQISPRISPARDVGAFVNYDLHAQQTTDSQSNGLSALFSGGYSRHNGVFLASILGRETRRSAGIIRLDTSWQRDDVESRSSLRIGDAISNGGALGATLRLTGIQWSTNFATDPYFVTYPTPTLAGQSALPSVVSVYVNNALELSQAIPAGPFNVNNLPVVNGQGQVQLNVTDVLGRVQTISEPYYASPELLKRGLSAFSYEAGFERLNYALQSDDYGSFLLEGTRRFGVTDRFTAEIHGELAAGRGMLGGTGAWSLGDSGILTAGYGGSESSGSTGDTGFLGYDYFGRRFSFFARAQVNSPTFRLVGMANQQNQLVRQEQLHVGVRLSSTVGANVTYTEQKTPAFGDARILAAGTSITLRRGSLNINALRDLGAVAGSAIQLSYVLPLDGRHLFAARAQISPQQDSAGLELVQNLPSSNVGYAYRLETDGGRTSLDEANFTAQDDYGTATAQVARFDGYTSFSGDVAGAVVLADGRALFARTVTGSYAIAELPGYPYIPVYINNQPEGKTNARGDVALPQLLPYQENIVSVVPTDLPLTANVGNARISVAPYAMSAAVVRFPTEPAGGATIALFSESGAPIPPYSIVQVVGLKRQWRVASGGEVYIFGMQPGTANFTSTVDGKTCGFSVEFPPIASMRQLPDLGRFICRVK